MPLDLIAVGDVMLDGALPAPVAGGRVHGRIELRAGGSAANAALAAARLGARAAVIGRVGVDAGICAGWRVLCGWRRRDVWLREVAAGVGEGIRPSRTSSSRPRFLLATVGRLPFGCT